VCGICGAVSFERAPLEPGTIERMTARLAHRGPDAHHTVEDGPVQLGCRRLAVIDPGRDGDQPMSHADQSLRLVFNGEIYDHDAHRRRLEARGHRFRTRTDTEVILHLYQEHGDECPAVPRDIDPAALHDFLSFDHVPGPGTVFAQISSLPPGHLAVVDRDGMRTRRYWQPSYRPRGEPMTVAAAGGGIVERLSESLRLTLGADVPLGVLLSGGLDSSAMVGLLRRQTDAPIHTFALGFEEPDRDERAHARLVADRFGTEHHEFAYRPDPARDLPAVLAHYDQPFSDPSILPTWELAERVREHVTVVLTGEGGDESFAGYDRYVKSALAAAWHRVPGGVRGGAAAVFDALFESAPHDRLAKRLQLFFAAGERPPEDLFAGWLLHFDHELKRDVYEDDFWRAAGGRDSAERIRELYRRSDADDRVNTLLDVDTRSYLADGLLVKLDMATMRHSVEGRCPYLDHELFAFVASLPGSLKLRRLRTKWILRRALRTLLPPSILNRRKLGFGPPVHRWLRGPLREFAFDTLTDTRARQRGYMKPHVVRRLLEEHASGRRNHGHQLWNLLVLELWQREALG
jgi:asparagine synthase (glutamine-hydrolysing)